MISDYDSLYYRHFIYHSVILFLNNTTPRLTYNETNLTPLLRLYCRSRYKHRKQSTKGVLCLISNELNTSYRESHENSTCTLATFSHDTTPFITIYINFLYAVALLDYRLSAKPQMLYFSSSDLRVFVNNFTLFDYK